MTSQHNTISSKAVQSLVQPDSPQSVADPSADPGDAADRQRALRMTGLLQTTLEIDQLLELFSTQLKPLVHHTLATFVNAEFGIKARRGKSGPHTCIFRLVVNDECLGELTLARGKPFTQDETKTIELMLCTLVYPLRNALLYRKALHAAHKDPLTGVNNRYTLNESLRREIDLARRYDRPLSLLVLDIDHFKNVNDTHGHAAGDYVIKMLAERVADCMRGTDMLFRYGGEEFVAVLSNTDENGAGRVAERIRKSVKRGACQFNDETIKITVSLGVATLLESDGERDLFRRADEALYQAKSDGRDCVRFAADEAVCEVG